MTDSEVQSSRSMTTTRSMRSAVSSASQLARVEEEDEQQNQHQSAVKTASVRFLDEKLESVHHFEVPSVEPSVEAVLWEWEQLDTVQKWNAERLEERTRLELRDLRNADTTPPYYDPTWD